MINEHQGGVECRSPLHSPRVCSCKGVACTNWNRLRRCSRSVASLASLRGLRPLLGAPAPVRTRQRVRISLASSWGLGASPLCPRPPLVCPPLLRRWRAFAVCSRSQSGFASLAVCSLARRSAPRVAAPVGSVGRPLASLRGRTLPLLPLGGRPPSRRAPRSRPRRGLACPSASPRRAPSARGAVRAPLPRLRPCGGFGRSLLPPSWGSMGGAQVARRLRCGAPLAPRFSASVARSHFGARAPRPSGVGVAWALGCSAPAGAGCPPLLALRREPAPVRGGRCREKQGRCYAPHSLSARAYSIVTSGRSCCKTSCTLLKSWYRCMRRTA